MLQIELTEEGWLDAVPAVQATLIRQLVDDGSTEEQVAEIWLSKVGASTTSGFGVGGPMQSFYANVKAEVIAFVCGDAKYQAERTQAEAIWKTHGKIGLVAAVAAAISPYVGLAAAAIIPVIALLFSLAAKVGLNAFCKSCGMP